VEGLEEPLVEDLVEHLMEDLVDHLVGMMVLQMLLVEQDLWKKPYPVFLEMTIPSLLRSLKPPSCVMVK